MTLYHELEGDEWRCFNGHVSYGEGFTPLDTVEDGRGLRGGRHDGWRL